MQHRRAGGRSWRRSTGATPCQPSTSTAASAAAASRRPARPAACCSLAASLPTRLPACLPCSQCAIYGNFSAPKVHEIVAARGTVLELLRPDEAGKVQVVHSTEVFGVIRTLTPFRCAGVWLGGPKVRGGGEGGSAGAAGAQRV